MDRERTITVGQLTDAIKVEFDAMCTEKVEQVNEIAKRVARDTVKRLRSSSPKRTGTYASGWTSKVTDKTVLGSETHTVYNAKRPGLGHLLEHGHLIAQTGGRTRAIVHIAPAEEAAVKQFVKEVTEL